ncbi:unnamed protein product [Ceutorhynchus assimilis]|uniref:Uncharacterized protein n=1 Tax=Ceutorhynchus assimilis TaxID=467358 RepID=A0A9N9QGA0_9CUCU|nr:unnamed protein product [Ceutorhynchus assimilis]
MTYFIKKEAYYLVEKLRQKQLRAFHLLIEKAKYYSRIFDSTPDIYHKDQTSQVLRYVMIEKQEVRVEESFIDSIETKSKTAEGITDMIVINLKADELDIMNCRGQAYDNAATMAGCHTGFWQPVLRDVNDAQKYLQTEGLNIHQCAHKISALQKVSEKNREEFMDDALRYAKSLCEELGISFELPRRRRKHIFGDGNKDAELSYEDDLRRTMFSSIDRVTAEIRERF